MFEPWQGNAYNRTRLLVLGESTYDWQEAGEWRGPQSDHCVKLVTDFIRDRDGPSFMKVVSKGLSNEETPDSDRLHYVWSHVAFTNYVPVSVGRSAVGERPRPSPAQWELARNEFQLILQRLRPLRIVVLGLSMWEAMPVADYGDGKGAQAYRLATGEWCWCLPLLHPARGLNWRSLAAAIYCYCGDILANQSS